MIIVQPLLLCLQRKPVTFYVAQVSQLLQTIAFILKGLRQGNQRMNALYGESLPSEGLQG